MWKDLCINVKQSLAAIQSTGVVSVLGKGVGLSYLTTLGLVSTCVESTCDIYATPVIGVCASVQHVSAVTLKYLQNENCLERSRISEVQYVHGEPEDSLT